MDLVSSTRKLESELARLQVQVKENGSPSADQMFTMVLAVGFLVMALINCLLFKILSLDGKDGKADKNTKTKKANKFKKSKKKVNDDSSDGDSDSDSDDGF